MYRADKCLSKSSNQSVNIFEEVDSESDGETEEINIVPLMEEIAKNKIFSAETLKLAVVNTACTKAVAGDKWYTNYAKDISNKLKHQIKSVQVHLKGYNSL